jgi:glycosyltransferase involved in cell wall biosynthesis
MKKILLISYMFPPIAGAGTQRPLKFVKHLPAYEITPVVFCPQKVFWKTYDEKLLTLPFLRRTKIYRCGIRRLQRYYDLRYKKGYKNHPYYYLMGLRYLCFLDFFSAWYFECRHKALEVALKEGVDCVLTTSPPHSIHLFGMFLKKKAGIPWLIDMRDAMYNDPNQVATIHPRLQSPIRYFYEKKFCSFSDGIISVSDPIVEAIHKRHSSQNLESKLHTITNGFDDEDFKDIRRTDERRNHLLITYTGSFMGKQTPKHFLEAIRLLIDKNSIDKSDILIRFIGNYDENIRGIFHRFKSQIAIEVLDFQPYEKSLWHQVNSDLLLLIVSIDKREGGHQTMTGKFFEYIGAKRPIFALVPDGPLKETIKKGRFGTVAPPKDVPKIAETFKGYYDQWKKEGALSFNPDMEVRKCFERKRLTEKLASILTDIMRVQPNQEIHDS